MVKIIKIKGDWENELLYYKDNFSRDYLNKTFKDMKHKSKWKNLNKHTLIHNSSNVRRNSRGFIDPKTMSTLEKLRNVIGLDDCQMIILKYAQGETNLYHKDYIPKHDHLERPDIKLSTRKEVIYSDYERMLLMLEDRKPGQFMQIGKRMINKWNKGDLFYYDGKKEYHSAGACGDQARLVLRITGAPTKKFKEFLKKKEIKI
jgi:hypothetical protein